MQFALSPTAVHSYLVVTELYEKQILMGVSVVAQDCCQLVLHSSREEVGMYFALNPAVVHWCVISAHLYA